MPWNGSGTFSLTDPPINFQASPISSADINSKYADIVAGLNNTMTRDGQASSLTSTITKSTQAFLFNGSTSQRATLGNIMSLGVLTRAEAAALTVTSGITVLGCYHGGVLTLFEKDASGTALTTADGQKWSPLGGNCTPAHWGGLPGQANDATTAVQACFDYARTKWSAALGNFEAWVNLVNQAWRCTSTVGVISLRQPGFRFGNGALKFDMSTGLGLQLFGTNTAEIVSPFRVEGTEDPTACPEALFCVGRAMISGSAAIAPSPKGTVHLDGCASKAQFINLGSEVSALQIIANGNTVPADTSTCIFHTGHMQDTVDIWGSVLTSTLCTLPGVADSPFSNILHHYGHGEYKRAAYWSGTITNISLGATTTVSFTVANTTQSSRMANGQEVWIPYGDAGGVVELHQRAFTIASLTIAGDGLSGSFVLSGENSTGYTSYTSGGQIWAKTGPFMIIGAGRGYSFGPQCYGLSYGEKGIVLLARNGGPSDFRFDGQTEDQVKYPISIDVGSSSAVALQRLEADLSSSSQVYAAPFQTIGSATLSLRDLRLHVVSHSTTLPLFANASATNIINANIRAPLALDVSGLQSFTGVVQTQNPAEMRIYASKTLYLAVASGQITLPNFAMQDKLFHDGDTDTAIRFPAADTLTVETGGSERMWIDSGGVGIGTTSPAFDLDVAGSDDGNLRIRAPGTSNSSDTFLRMVLAGNSARNFINFGDVDDADVGIIAYHHSDDSLRLTVNAGERLRVTSAGYLGIGVTAPGSPLAVAGLPTSAAGLSAGDVWNDGGTLKIV